MADAVKNKCRLIVTSGSLQTNHGMLTALCASKLGLHCVLFLLIEERGFSGHLSGNLILDEFAGCDVEFVYVADIMENNDLTAEERDRLSGERLEACKSSGLYRTGVSMDCRRTIFTISIQPEACLLAYWVMWIVWRK